MPKGLWRVREAATFGAFTRSGRRSKAGPLWVTWIPRAADGPPRVAFAIGRGVGGAVVRNRLRRRLLAVLRDGELGPGAYLVGAGPAANELSYDELKALVSRALKALPSTSS